MQVVIEIDELPQGFSIGDETTTLTGKVVVLGQYESITDDLARLEEYEEENPRSLCNGDMLFGTAN